MTALATPVLMARHFPTDRYALLLGRLPLSLLPVTKRFTLSLPRHFINELHGGVFIFYHIYLRFRLSYLCKVSVLNSAPCTEWPISRE